MTSAPKPPLEEKQMPPKRMILGILATVIAVLLLVLTRLLLWGWRSDPLGLVESPAPCNDEAVVARKTSRCSHPDHTGELVLVGPTIWLVCTCERPDASTFDPKDLDAIAASTD